MLADPGIQSCADNDRTVSLHATANGAVDIDITCLNTNLTAHNTPAITTAANIGLFVIDCTFVQGAVVNPGHPGVGIVHPVELESTTGKRFRRGFTAIQS